MSEAFDAQRDEIDAALLDELAAVYLAADPPPADLADRVLFAVALRDVDAEVARLGAGLATSGVRSAEQSRTITFDADSLTIMITIVALPGGLRRIDGWLAPAAPLRVELRTAGGAATHVVTADDTGRFVVDAAAAGLAQVVVQLPEEGRRVITPAVDL